MGSHFRASARFASTYYRGRIAPTPSGHLHLGHAATFLRAYERARQFQGIIVLRIEDLDRNRCKLSYVEKTIDDLRWLGIKWHEGPHYQSDRRALYLDAWRRLRDLGCIYPCIRSRNDVARAPTAPHEEGSIFPVEWRTPLRKEENSSSQEDAIGGFVFPMAK